MTSPNTTRPPITYFENPTRSFGSAARGEKIDGSKCRELLIELSSDVFCSLLDEYEPSLGIYYLHHVDAVEQLHFMHYRPEAFPGVEPNGSEIEGEAIERRNPEVAHGPRVYSMRTAEPFQSAW